MQKNYPIEITWHSFELHPAGSPPMHPQRLAQIEASRPQLEEMARERYGLEIHPGPFGIDSRPALIADKYAEAHGKGHPFHDAVMKAYWQESRSIDDKELLKEIAGQVGLDPASFAEAFTRPEYEAEVNKDIALAREYRLNGVPALIFDMRYLVSGAQPYEMLKQVVEKILEEQAKG